MEYDTEISVFPPLKTNRKLLWWYLKQRFKDIMTERFDSIISCNVSRGITING